MALHAFDVADDVLAGGHAAGFGFLFVDVDDFFKEVCFAMLASEVLQVGRQ